jgi:hypothetical protein
VPPRPELNHHNRTRALRQKTEIVDAPDEETAEGSFIVAAHLGAIDMHVGARA